MQVLILSSIMDPWSLSLYVVNVLRVRENDRGRLTEFVDFIDLVGEIVFC